MAAETSLGEADSSNATKDNKFVCDGCGSVLKQTSALYHIRNVCENVGVDCPICELSFISQRGMEMHHATQHGESISDVETECAWCGCEFNTAKRNVKRSANNFCSDECKGYWSAQNNELPTERDRLTVDCTVCGDNITRKRCEIERSEKHFCSGECQAIWKSNNVCGENHPLWDGGKVEKECTYCGDSVIRYEHKFRNNPFCGTSCYANWLSENWSGEDNPRWKGDDATTITNYGPNWKQQKQKALMRDQYRCQRCYKSEHELGIKPDVHHIKRIKYFKNNFSDPDWYEKANVLSNLVCLCKSCHRKWEGIPLRPQ